MLGHSTDAVRWIQWSWFTILTSIFDAVTAMSFLTIFSACIGQCVTVLGAVVAFLVIGTLVVCYAVTTRRLLATGFSACIGRCVTVLSAVVAFLVIGTLVVYYVVAARGTFASFSTGIGCRVAVQSAVITFFAVHRVEVAISTGGRLASFVPIIDMQLIGPPEILYLEYITITRGGIAVSVACFLCHGG